MTPRVQMGFERFGRLSKRTSARQSVLGQLVSLDLRTVCVGRMRDYMTRVTQAYGLNGPVPFLDVHLEQDNRLFIEPSAIRAAAASDRWAHAADEAITSYFARLIDTVRTGDRATGLVQLDDLHEPNETRLGMTLSGVAGHGVGAGLAQGLWDEMHRNPVCATTALVNRIEDLAPFIDGIGPDVISDVCTRVAFGVLTDFTTEMMATFPALTRTTRSTSVRAWNPATLQWINRSVTVPTFDQRDFLLVPLRWIWKNQLLNASSYYQIQALGQIQNRQTKPPRVAGGRPTAPTKDSLKADFPDVRPTNVAETMNAAGKGVDLVSRHAAHVQNRFKRDLQADQDGLNNLLV